MDRRRAGTPRGSDPAAAPATSWSATLWSGVVKEDATIGVGRSTGVSRVPQQDFVLDPSRIDEASSQLAARVRELEQDGQALVDGGAASASDEWSDIVGQFRVMS
jgi:hypothetical protein